MSSPINEFPTEVLCRIFDYLSWADGKRVATVCHRWYDIINSDHYLRQRKLILYNYKKVYTFFGISVPFLMKQRNVELISNAMLDTEQLLATFTECIHSEQMAMEFVGLQVTTEHKLMFRLVIDNLNKLKNLKQLSVRQSEGSKSRDEVLELRSDTLEVLKLSFYQNMFCRLVTPQLRALKLVVRYQSDMELLELVSDQLVELKLDFHSSELLPYLFRCSFRNIAKMHISIKRDKYLPYTVVPVYIGVQHTDSVFCNTITGLKELTIVNMCNTLSHHFLLMFRLATELTRLTLNYIVLETEVIEIINDFRNLEYLDIKETSATHVPLVLTLPRLRALVLPFKHHSILPYATLNGLTHLQYTSPKKSHSSFLQDIGKTFVNLKVLCLAHFDYELDERSLSKLNELKQLEKLIIRTMSVSHRLFVYCPVVPNVQTLIVNTAVTSIDLLDPIPDKFPGLYNCRIEYCFFYAPEQSGLTSFDVLSRRMPRCRVSTIGSNIFTEGNFSSVLIPG